MSQEVGEVLGYLSSNKGSALLNGWIEKQPIDNRTLSWIDNRRWRRKWMELYPQMVVWYQDAGMVPRGYIMLTPATLVRESAGKGSSIEVVCSSGRTLRFRTRDAQSHHAWLAGVKRAIASQQQQQQPSPQNRTAVLAGSGGRTPHSAASRAHQARELPSKPAVSAAAGSADDIGRNHISSDEDDGGDGGERLAAGSRYRLRSLTHGASPSSTVGNTSRAPRTRGQTTAVASASASSLAGRSAAAAAAAAADPDSERRSGEEDDSSSEDEAIGNWVAAQRARNPQPARGFPPARHAHSSRHPQLATGKKPIGNLAALPTSTATSIASASVTVGVTDDAGGDTAALAEQVPTHPKASGGTKSVPPGPFRSHLETAATGVASSGDTGSMGQAHAEGQ